MIRKSLLSVLLLFISQLCFALTPKAALYTIDSIIEAYDFVDENTLVILDLDHTVFVADEVYGHANWFYDQIGSAKKLGYDTHTIIRKMYPHWQASQAVTAVKPVEPEVIEFVHQLQAKGIPVIGGTSRQTLVADSTLKQVHSLNIRFNEYPTNVLADSTFVAKTLVKEGVIFCADYNDKGEVLRRYLDGHLDDIQKVVFVDDSYGNVTSVLAQFSHLPVEVVSLYYPVVSKTKAQSWDPALGAKKFYQAYLDQIQSLPAAFFEDQEAVAQQQSLLNRHEAFSGTYQYQMLGRQYIGLPGVFSPIIFSGDGYLQSKIPSQKGKTFLELGPATGYFATHLALEGALKVVALDINPLAVLNTKQNAQLHKVEQLVDARVSNLFEALNNETFDTIFWDIPQSHTEKKDLSLLEQSVFDPNHQLLTSFLAQAKQHLKPGGKAYLTYSPTHGNWLFFEAAAQYYGWGLKQVATVGDKETFEIALVELINNA